MILIISSLSVSFADPVSTPWGQLSEIKASQLCSAEHVFIGTIESATPFTGSVGVFSGRPHSTVEWSVERNIRATPGPFTMDQPGGFVDNRAHLLGGFPIPSPGRRYFMVVGHRPTEIDGYEAGSLWFQFATQLNPSDELPPVEDLRASLEEICND